MLVYLPVYEKFYFYRADIINISSIINLFLSGAILGKTVEFWLMYIDMIMISVFMRFSNFNMHNYARYCAYCAQVLSQTDTLYSRLEDTLSLKGLSIQAQDRYPLQTAVDERGKQTINRDGKTSGGIRNVASSSSSVLKWCLNT